MTQEEKKNLAVTACKVRMGVIEATHGAKSGHPGTPISLAPAAYLLYQNVMRHDPADQCFDGKRMIYGGFAPILDA